ncbi:hypothetical protein [Scatolibacter rhodanostii]|uniref:hypothetical protein n=1 Tax=Scatolibacter rhodanostii TaxID=2014781 RepID=UPI000C08710E|nr:hypothetical protein [Scatolibacter rhodanostii]
MAENRCGPVCGGGDYFKEAVCIDTMRVYDSCADKDCLEDVRVLIPAGQQQYLECAKDAKIRSVEVITVCCDVSDVPFKPGCYTVEMTYFLEVSVDVYTPQGVAAITGVAIFNKTSIMHGGVSTGSKAFSSDENCLSLESLNRTDAPIATVQVADPIGLHVKVCPVYPGYRPHCHCGCDYDSPIPDIITNQYGPFEWGESCKAIYASIGLFSIIQLSRKVQMLIPAYDFCIPTKESTNSTVASSPCEVFDTIDFPTEAFYPCKQDCCVPNGNNSNINNSPNLNCKK